MPSDPLFWICACIAVTLVGLAKGGFAGMGALATPILALAVPPVEAVAILLPILVVQDVVSVWAFRHDWNRRIVLTMLPTAIIGIGIAYLFAASVPAATMLAALGITSIAFGMWRLWVERGGKIPIPSTSPDWVGAIFGGISGFFSQLAHFGAPPFQMWVAPKRLPHLEFVGTSALFFAAMNWVKVPAYFALGELTANNLRLSAALVPIAIASTWAGVWLVRRIDAARFYRFIYLVMIALGMKLLFDALA